MSSNGTKLAFGQAKTTDCVAEQSDSSKIPPSSQSQLIFRPRLSYSHACTRLPSLSALWSLTMLNLVTEKCSPVAKGYTLQPSHHFAPGLQVRSCLTMDR